MKGILFVDLWSLWVGTHITKRNQLPDGIKHFQKLFWDRESWCIIITFLGLSNFWPLWSYKVLHKSEISILLPWQQILEKNLILQFYWISMMHQLSRFQTSFLGCWITLESWLLIVKFVPVHKSPLNTPLTIWYFNCYLSVTNSWKMSVNTI